VALPPIFFLSIWKASVIINKKIAMFFRIIIAVFFIFLPTGAFAWGPLTHVYLGSEVFYLGSLLPAGIYSLIRKYRQDFLYGNLMADMIIGKKLISKNKNPHSWDIALKLLSSASTESERAFSLGYMSHLAADTVAHNGLTMGKKQIGHTMLELKADSIIDKKHWFSAMSIGRDVQKRNDIFMEHSLEMFIFSFKTNKRIFKTGVALSALNRERIIKLIDKNPVLVLPTKGEIESLHEESLDRILDVLQKGKRSRVLKDDPIN